MTFSRFALRIFILPVSTAWPLITAADPMIGVELGKDPDRTLLASDWCPKSAVEWRYFRDRVARALPTNNSQSYLEKIKRCLQKTPAPSAAALACTDNIKGYLEQLNARPAPESLEMTSIPEALQKPEIFQALSDGNKLTEAVAKLRAISASMPKDQQFKVVALTASIDSADNHRTKHRVLVIYPGNPVKWISFSANNTGTSTMKAAWNVSVVAVKPGQYGQPNQTYFQDRLYTVENNTIQWQKVEHAQAQNCLTCHAVGLNPFRDSKPLLMPKGAALGPLFTDEEKTVLSEAEESIADLSPTEFGSSLDRKYFGPGLGPVKERDPAFIAECSKNATTMSESIDTKKIAKAMNCSQCHNDEYVNRLSGPWLKDGIGRNPIYSGHMPPNQQLNRFERNALALCLEAEYFGTGLATSNGGQFRQWLTENNCGVSAEELAAYMASNLPSLTSVFLENEKSKINQNLEKDLIKEILKNNLKSLQKLDSMKVPSKAKQAN